MSVRAIATDTPDDLRRISQRLAAIAAELQEIAAELARRTDAAATPADGPEEKKTPYWDPDRPIEVRASTTQDDGVDTDPGGTP